MDGFLLAEATRSHPILKDTPIILLTSSGHPGDAQRCERLGIGSYLMKPAKHSELLEAITAVVGRTAMVAEIPDQLQRDGTSLPPLNVLLVEDGKANQILARGMLKKWGHQVVVAENGEQAIQKWRQGEFNVILMDVQMPVMDGIEATRRIREMEVRTNSHIPIVAMTAHAMKGDRDRCLNAGMDNYVAKPFRKSDLHAVLSQYFSADDQSNQET
jgi:CheY-like chemotaxis protein